MSILNTLGSVCLMSTKNEITDIFEYLSQKAGFDDFPFQNKAYKSILTLINLPEEERNLILSYAQNITPPQKDLLKTYDSLFSGESHRGVPQLYLDNIKDSNYSFFERMYQKLIDSPNIEFTTDFGEKLVVNVSKTELRNTVFHFYVSFPNSKYPFLRLVDNTAANKGNTDLELTEFELEQIKKNMLAQVISRCNDTDKTLPSAYNSSMDGIYNLQVAIDGKKFLDKAKINTKLSKESFWAKERSHFGLALRYILPRHSVGDIIDLKIFDFILGMPSYYKIKVENYICITRKNEDNIIIEMKSRKIVSLDKDTEIFKQIELIKELMNTD